RLRAAFMLGSFLDVGYRVRRLAGCLAVVDLNLADALCGIDSLVSTRRLEDSDRNERSVHRVPSPVRGSVYLVLDGLEYFPGIGVTEGVGLVLQDGAQDAVADLARELVGRGHPGAHGLRGDRTAAEQPGQVASEEVSLPILEESVCLGA